MNVYEISWRGSIELASRERPDRILVNDKHKEEKNWQVRGRRNIRHSILILGDHQFCFFFFPKILINHLIIYSRILLEIDVKLTDLLFLEFLGHLPISALAHLPGSVIPQWIHKEALGSLLQVLGQFYAYSSIPWGLCPFKGLGAPSPTIFYLSSSEI